MQIETIEPPCQPNAFSIFKLPKKYEFPAVVQQGNLFKGQFVFLCGGSSCKGLSAE